MKHIFFLVAVVFLLSACERDLTIEVPRKEPRLVVNAWIAKGDPIVLKVGKSRYILDPGNFSNPQQDMYVVNNAVPVVYENNVAIDTLVYNATDHNYISPRNRTIQAGNTYTVKISAPGFTEAEVVSIVPSQSEINGLTRVRNARTDGYGNQMDEVTITLNDPAEKNFYMLQVYGATYGGPGYPVYCVNTSDKDVEPLGYSDPIDPETCFDGSKLLMRDDNFNGRTKLLKLFIDSDDLNEFTAPNGQVYRPFIKVNRITEDYFRYVKSFEAYYNASDNPFAEPVNVFTNVKDGYGVFSTYTIAVDTLR